VSEIVKSGFGQAIADRIAAEHASLAARWFARLRDLLPVDANEVFPTDSLLDHIPSLIVDISEYLKAPEEQAIAANTLVVEKARELGALRHQQRASLHQVLREYQLLGSILLRFVEDESIRLMLPASPAECVSVVSRLHHAVAVLLQETVETFVALYTQTISDQAERLRQFTRMATHEWRQPLAPISTAVSLMRLSGLTASQRTQALDMIARNVSQLADLTYKLERVARIEDGGDNPSLQEVPLTVVATEAARQLREMADARQVELIVATDMPTLTVDVGRLELALVNLISNAIKYSDPAKPRRVVEIDARLVESGEVEVCVRDNGLGIPAGRISQIFRRFTRAHADRIEMESVSGVGLGLAIVDDCATAMNGSIVVESTEGSGTVFCLKLPATASRHPSTPSSNAPAGTRLT
jgi:signal transduction histidine kinase